MELHVIKDGDQYVGYAPEFRAVIVEANSLEELKQNCKTLLQEYLEFYLKRIEEELFELIEFNNLEDWLGEDYKIQQELNKYKETFGDL